jgi:hypothetical protein
MNTPSFKTLFFPYTLNTYLRQYKNNLTTLPIPNYSKIRLLDEKIFQSAQHKREGGKYA